MPSENKNAVFVRELKIDDIAPVFHLGEQYCNYSIIVIKLI